LKVKKKKDAFFVNQIVKIVDFSKKMLYIAR